MANKKKNKKEIKDSVDIHDIEALKQQENNKKNIEEDIREEKIKISFIDYINDKRIPIYTYCRKLFKYDFKNMKENPNELSEDTLFIKNVSNKKRFILKIIYLISMLLIAILLLVISILLLTGIIGSFSPDVASNTYIPGILMAFSIVILLFFI